MLILDKHLRQDTLLSLPGSAPFDTNESNEHSQRGNDGGEQ